MWSIVLFVIVLIANVRKHTITQGVSEYKCWMKQITNLIAKVDDKWDGRSKPRIGGVSEMRTEQYICRNTVDLMLTGGI